MTATMSATSVRRQFSEFIDGVVRDKPQFFKRNRDTILSLSEHQMQMLLENFRFHVTVEREEDHSFTVLPEDFDLIGVGNTKDEAIYDLAEQLMEYSQEYYDEFHLYANAPNRAHHFPYILHVLTKDSVEDVVSLIDE